MNDFLCYKLFRLNLNDDDVDNNNEDAENYVEMKTYGKDIEYVHFLHKDMI